MGGRAAGPRDQAEIDALGEKIAAALVVRRCSRRSDPRPPPRPPQPLADAVAAGPWDWAEPVVRVGAALAAAGALLALVAGLGRTSLAMAREGDLPRWLDAVHPRYQVPHRAELTVAAVVVVLVLVADLRGVIGFSSFGVLLYYFVANAAARAQPEQRRYPRWLQVLGCAGCLVLVATLPWEAVVAGVLVFLVGIVVRVVRLVRGRRWLRPRASRLPQPAVCRTYLPATS